MLASAVLALGLTTSSLDPRWTDPWPAILLGWYLALAVAAWAFPAVPVRVAAVHLAAAAIALAGFEQWLLVTTKGRPGWGSDEGGTYSGSFVRPDALLGYAPARVASVRQRREREGRTLFDVAVTTGPDGFRITPPPLAEPPEGAVLVLGCSFAFGEGLDDGDTLASRLAEETGRRLAVRNAAFSGYGPHQALALLESGRALRGLPAGRPLAAVYVALADHVPRSLGRRPWSRGTPRYVEGPSGALVRDGAFGELHSVLERWITWRRLLGSERRVASGDLARAVAMVVRTRELLRAQHPGAPMAVVFWDERDDLSRDYRAALSAAGFPVLDVSRVLPGYPEVRDGWQLPWDGHPTAQANARLARALGEALRRGAGGPTR